MSRITPSIQLKIILLSILALVTSARADVPQLGVYRWAAPSGPAQVDTYASWLGRPDMWAEDFLGYQSWDAIQWPGWLTNAWKPWLEARAGRKLLMGIPMLPSGSSYTLQQGANGNYDIYFRRCAEDLAAKGIADKVIIRLGWEFNGGWFPWKASANPTAWVNYWRRIVDVMRAVPGASGLKFCFNPVRGYEQIASDTVYPGDAYVDYIALDLYDECYDTTIYPYPAGASATEIRNRQLKAWNFYLGGTTWGYGLLYWHKFATDRGKGFGLGEWGVNNKIDGGLQRGGLDNPVFIEKMHEFLTTRPIAFAVYFDVQAPDGHHQLSPPVTEFPLASAKFLELFRGTDIIKDNTDSGVTFSGTWTVSTSITGFFGTNYQHDGNTDGKSVTYNVTIPSAGNYSVYARWVSHSTYNSWVPMTVTHSGGDTTVYKNQQWGGGVWQLLGTYSFNAGATGRVKISNLGGGPTIADAVRFTRQ